MKIRIVALTLVAVLVVATATVVKFSVLSEESQTTQQEHSVRAVQYLQDIQDAEAGKEAPVCDAPDLLAAPVAIDETRVTAGSVDKEVTVQTANSGNSTVSIETDSAKDAELGENHVASSPGKIADDTGDKKIEEATEFVATENDSSDESGRIGLATHHNSVSAEQTTTVQQEPPRAEYRTRVYRPRYSWRYRRRGCGRR